MENETKAILAYIDTEVGIALKKRQNNRDDYKEWYYWSGRLDELEIIKNFIEHLTEQTI